MIPSQPEDDDFLFQLYTGTRRDELLTWGWDEAAQHAFLSMQWKAQKHSYATQYPEAAHRIIRYDGERAGRMLVNNSGQELLLVDLSLLPEFQNLGIGTAILRELQAEAAREDKPLRLSVLKTNPARQLYERLGFHLTGEGGMHFLMEWTASVGTTSSQDKNPFDDQKKR